MYNWKLETCNSVIVKKAIQSTDINSNGQHLSGYNAITFSEAWLNVIMTCERVWHWGLAQGRRLIYISATMRLMGLKVFGSKLLQSIWEYTKISIIQGLSNIYKVYKASQTHKYQFLFLLRSVCLFIFW